MRLYQVTVDEEKHQVVQQNEANLVGLLKSIVVIGLLRRWLLHVQVIGAVDNQIHFQKLVWVVLQNQQTKHQHKSPEAENWNVQKPHRQVSSNPQIHGDKFFFELISVQLRSVVQQKPRWEENPNCKNRKSQNVKAS